jgi:hypothetical protein
VQNAAGIATMGVTALILAARLRRAGRAQRRVLLPLDLYGIAALLLTPLTPDVIEPLTGMPPDVTVAVQLVVLGLVPVAFAAGMLRGGFARTGEIQELGAWLPPSPTMAARRWPDSSTGSWPSRDCRLWNSGSSPSRLRCPCFR